MRQRVLLEMVIKQPFSEKEEDTAATIWSEFVVEKRQEVGQQTEAEQPSEKVIEVVDSDDEPGGLNVDNTEYNPLPIDGTFNINQGDPDMMRFWMAEEELPEWMSCARRRKVDKSWSAEENACGNLSLIHI